MQFFLSPSPFPYGDSPYGYGDCVFGHPFSHALNNIFFAEASQFSRAHRANIPLHTIRSPHKDWVKLDLVDMLVLDQRTTG
jgi:hypothetical protein